jgi:uncharacterized protein YndB with AHSA1/START domain
MRIETSVVVDRPIDAVWAFLTEPFNMPRLGGSWLGTRLTSPGPIGLGTTFEGRLTILGFETRIGGTITGWEPPHAVAISVIGAGGSGSISGTLESTATGTKVVRTVEIEPRPAFKLPWWIALPFMRRRQHASDQRLKRLLEAGQG